jgi:hypothetical protein
MFFILPSSIIHPSHQAANYQVLLKQALNKKAIAAETTITKNTLPPYNKTETQTFHLL